MIEIVPVSSTNEIEVTADLFREYASSLPVDLEYQGFSAELRSLPGVYQAPTGALFIARVDGIAAGCVAVRQLSERVCEMKRLYVRPAYRGGGLGPLLVAEAITAARALGYAEIWLDTLASMTAAHRLYLSLGFREISSYGSDAMPGTRYFGLRLSPAPDADVPGTPVLPVIGGREMPLT